MVNHNRNHEHENDAIEPGGGPADTVRGYWVGLLAGLLIGGLAGAVAMLLLAPESGKKTRTKLQRQSAEWRDQAADTMEDAVAQTRVKARQITHDVRKQAEELEKRGHAMLDGQKGR